MSHIEQYFHEDELMIEQNFQGNFYLHLKEKKLAL